MDKWARRQEKIKMTFKQQPSAPESGETSSVPVKDAHPLSVEVGRFQQIYVVESNM